MDVREALYTTRAMRRMRPDPIPTEVRARILDAAIRAPSGGNSQRWRFVLVDDRSVKEQLGPVYRRCIQRLWDTVYRDRLAAADADPDAPESANTRSVQRSAQHLADHFESTPLFVVPFIRNDPDGSSIYPAVWSLMLAARAEGVGSALTTVLSFEADAVHRLLGVPEGGGWRMAACIAMGYPLGRWGVPARAPVHEVAARNHWDGVLDFTVPEPLWSVPS
jgi:nitroreductase